MKIQAPSPLTLKKGHVEFKTGYCSECGDQFNYPKHHTPRPTFCEAHDPEPPIKIDLSQFESKPGLHIVDTDRPVWGPGDDYEIHHVDGARYHVESGQTLYETEPVATGTTWTSGTGVIHIPGMGYFHGSGDRVETTQILEVDGANARVLHTSTQPLGNKFADSRRMRSVEAIRADYTNRIAEVQQPTVSDIILPAPKHGKHITLIHAGDVHIGTDACTYQAFRELLDYVLHTENVYIAFQGDLVDLLTAHSVGVLAEQALTIQDQFTIATSDLMPLARANKIVWMIRGNHEERLDKATKNIVDGAQWMARILDVNYLASEGYTRVHCNGESYLSYNLHGFNCGSSAGARRNKMDAMLGKFPSADMITCGHNHQLDIIPRTDDVIMSNNMRAHKSRYGIYTGTYHSYIGYPAEFGLGAGPLGCVAVHFDIEYGIIKPEILPVIAVEGRYRHALPKR